MSPGRLATVYDVDGPRVRLGLAWFGVACLAVVVHPLTTALAYGVVAGLAARQVVVAWKAPAWLPDLAPALAVLPVLGSLAGRTGLVVGAALALVVAVGAATAPDTGLFAGAEGRLASAAVLAVAVVPGVAAGGVVLVRRESLAAAIVLVLLVSVYEVGDYIVGSGGSSPVEGPLAGAVTTLLVGLPLALVLISPFDHAGEAALVLAAVLCPLGQAVGSAMLPGAGARAPALRRIDSLLVLGLVWAAASGAL